MPIDPRTFHGVVEQVRAYFAAHPDARLPFVDLARRFAPSASLAAAAVAVLINERFLRWAGDALVAGNLRPDRPRRRTA